MGKVRHLSDDQKKVIAGLSAPSQMDVQEIRIKQQAFKEYKYKMNQGSKSQHELNLSAKILQIWLNMFLLVLNFKPHSIHGFVHHGNLQERRCLYGAMDRRFSKGGPQKSPGLIQVA